MTQDNSIAVPLLALTMGAASPTVGHYATILMGATFGSLWTISRLDAIKPWQAAKMFFRAVTVSVVFTGLIAHFASDWMHYPVLGPVAFFLAWVGDQWTETRDKMIDLINRGLQALSRRKE